MEYSYADIAKMIDHSLLRPELTEEDILRECKIAKDYKVASVCCVPADVATASKFLAGTDVKVGAAVGFLHSYHRTETKVIEAEQAIKDGAEELDMVIHIGKLRSRNFDYVKKDIKAVVDVAHRHGAIVKVILEKFYLTDELKKIGCNWRKRPGQTLSRPPPVLPREAQRSRI